MKKLLMIGCVLLLSNMSRAQKIDLGVKAGLNVAGLSLSNDGKLVGVSYNNRTAYHVGAYALVKFGKIGIQPELLFSKQGQNFTTPYNSNLNSSLTYINIPLMVKYYFAGGLNLQAGPQFGLLVSAKGDEVALSNGFVGSAYHDRDLKGYLKGTDLSFAFGLGLDLPLGTSIGIRYTIGLSDINNKSAGSSQTTAPGFSLAYTQNQVLQLSVGYKLFRVGK